MNRFYCPQSDLSSDIISIINKDEIHHLRHVLRLKTSDEIIVFNGQGIEALGNIISSNSKEVQVKIISIKNFKRKSPSIILACAIPKKSKFELIIEKSTELGVDEIIPLKTERTEIKLDKERLEKKNLRYKSVTINDAKQSCRKFIPNIHPITPLNDALEYLKNNSIVFIPSLTGKRTNIFEQFKTKQISKSISFLIGPEGDFTNKEYNKAHSNGCIPITLGENILKVETAAICSLSCALQYFHAPPTSLDFQS